MSTRALLRPLSRLRGRVGVGESRIRRRPRFTSSPNLRGIRGRTSQQSPSGAPTPTLPRKRERERASNVGAPRSTFIPLQAFAFENDDVDASVAAPPLPLAGEGRGG